jgi:hypothetical protein
MLWEINKYGYLVPEMFVERLRISPKAQTKKYKEKRQIV